MVEIHEVSNMQNTGTILIFLLHNTILHVTKQFVILKEIFRSILIKLKLISI